MRELNFVEINAVQGAAGPIETPAKIDLGTLAKEVAGYSGMTCGGLSPFVAFMLRTKGNASVAATALALLGGTVIFTAAAVGSATAVGGIKNAIAAHKA